MIKILFRVKTDKLTQYFFIQWMLKPEKPQYWQFPETPWWMLIYIRPAVNIFQVRKSQKWAYIAIIQICNLQIVRYFLCSFNVGRITAITMCNINKHGQPFFRFGFLMRPEPWQMLQLIYPELPPVLRTRLRVLIVCFANHITANKIISSVIIFLRNFFINSFPLALAVQPKAVGADK